MLAHRHRSGRQEVFTAGPGSGVMESLQKGGRGINDIAAGEDVGFTDDNLAATMITSTCMMIFVRHCDRILPRLRRRRSFGMKLLGI